mgnify:CR=1 FL=1
MDRFTFSSEIPLADIEKTKRRFREINTDLTCKAGIIGQDKCCDDWTDNYVPSVIKSVLFHIGWKSDRDGKSFLAVECDTSIHDDEFMLVLRELLKVEPDDVYYWSIPFAMTDPDHMRPNHFGGGLMLITREEFHSLDQNQLFDITRGKVSNLFVETL